MRSAVEHAKGRNIVVYGHEHRIWEYGSALCAIEEHFHRPITAIDVGSGGGIFAMALALEGHEITEIDPQIKSPEKRMRTMGLPIRSLSDDLLTHQGTYDAALSISVMEHLPPDAQEAGWKALCNMVRPGGMLFATVDYGEGTWGTKLDRESFFDRDYLAGTFELLSSNGFHFEEPDLTFLGAFVKDYTFFRIVAYR